MQNLRTIGLALAGICVFAAAAVFTISLTLVSGAILTVFLAARMLSTRAKPAPLYAKAKHREMHVWNDGRGTIIDL